MLVCCLSCSNKKDSNPSPVLARVDDETLRLNQITNDGLVYSKSVPHYVDQWVKETVLFNEAKKRGVHKDLSIIQKKDAFFKSLIVSSFVESVVLPKVSVEKDSVRFYYEKNKKEFVRSSDEVFVQHYFSEKFSTAKKIETSLKNDVGESNINLTSFLGGSRYLERGVLPPFFDEPLFSSKDRVVGPIKAYSSYHVFNVISRFKKGSVVGFDVTYDKIYQKLYKIKETKLTSMLLDSLKKEKVLYINPNFQ